MEKTAKEPPKGYVDAAEDLLLDMENSPPDDDEVVIRVYPDGRIEEFPAKLLPKSDW